MPALMKLSIGAHFPELTILRTYFKQFSFFNGNMLSFKSKYNIFEQQLQFEMNTFLVTDNENVG